MALGKIDQPLVKSCDVIFVPCGYILLTTWYLLVPFAIWALVRIIGDGWMENTCNGWFCFLYVDIE